MRLTSVVDDAKEVARASALIGLGARLQVLEAEFAQEQGEAKLPERE